jgi:UDP-glucose 4-epimerase
MLRPRSRQNEIASGAKSVPFPDDRKAIDIGDYYADFRKIDKLLSWSPQVNLEEGLKQTLEFYRANQAHYWD